MKRRITTRHWHTRRTPSGQVAPVRQHLMRIERKIDVLNRRDVEVHKQIGQQLPRALSEDTERTYPIYPVYTVDNYTPEEKMALVNKVVKEKTFVRIKEGGRKQPLDMQTANAIKTVYDSLDKPENKRKFTSMPLTQMANISWKVIGKASG